jgi:hypothetical protein
MEMKLLEIFLNLTKAFYTINHVGLFGILPNFELF